MTLLKKKVFVAKLPLDISLPIKDTVAPKNDFSSIDDLRIAVELYEKAIINERLKQYNGNRAKAAESLGLPKRTLAHKCQKLEIQFK
ncbi:hypothetical protein UA31_21210 [Photobacterium angustum]|uniref:helix-turn-helix domain-containing protein n=1 Tax=Photobacterium angustum TaxID=661 RepID=UPI0005D3A2F8|nr:helix-turn-helix domain-containing protein [Photobacterium angustum]KJF79686.1 hypothetical protein UB36_21205 [Photobacterium damselae subsp. damselae]KJF99843.1 hypothetical protein UB35_20365 [Photobacterium angustum]KJG15324.1 hypothetical protein UA33_20080 [Photobacterium angustum]KJG43194.1 hypothetical protein UA31_21210 [Photobacterium angustum]KJG50288.1 hypothetical protein UA34_21210 [Photobacterium angustum]